MTQLEFLRKHFPKIAKEFERLRMTKTEKLSEAFGWDESELGYSFWNEINSLVYLGINRGIEFVRHPINETCINHNAEHLI